MIDNESKLKAAFKAALKAANDSNKPQPIHCPQSLTLQVRPSGAASWIVRLTVNGKRGRYGLGPWPIVTLEQATRNALDAKRAARLGTSPTDAKRDARADSQTFSDAAHACYKVKQGNVKAGTLNERTVKQWWKNVKDEALPKLGRLQVAKVRASDLADALEPIWLERPEVAKKTKRCMLEVVRFAAQKDWRESAITPDDLKGLLPKQAKGTSRAALDYRDAPELMKRLQQGKASVPSLALQFIVATSVRFSEAIGATWAEFDLEGSAPTWTIPAERMKIARAHTVFLSDTAMNVLRTLETLEQGPLLFEGAKAGAPISETSLRKALKAASEGLKVRDGDLATIHGFRATFKTWAQEQCPTVPDSVSEVQLAHGDPDKVRAAYARADFAEMRADMSNAWGRHLSGDQVNVVRLAG